MIGVEMKCELKINPEMMALIEKMVNDFTVFATVFANMQGIPLETRQNLIAEVEASLTKICAEIISNSIEIKIGDTLWPMK